MPLTNYRDVGKRGSDTSAGFQFQFSCANCARTWDSPFKPYRKGQFAGLIYKLAYFLGDRGSMSRATNAVANAGEKRARETALEEAIELAEQRYAECPGCRRTVCEDCWNTGAQLCETCLTKGVPASGGGSTHAGGGTNATAEGGAALKCPNCSAAMAGGRFCPECGFDMASTHKTCPGCGTLCTRSARFCTDCGHGF